MKLNLRKTGVSLLLVAVLPLGISGCSMNTEQGRDEGGAHSSRVKLYPSVKSMADDSSAVVVGTVTEQRVAADIDETTEFTISTVEVSEVQKSKDSISRGDKLIVRQVGSQKQAAPGPLMAVGATYLLYLTPSGLEGELREHFYITGANAGLYQAASAERRASYASNDVFKQVEKQDGEDLPAEITLSESTK